MSIFSTEFPIKANIEKALFLSQAIAWLRGNKYSRILEDNSIIDLDRSFAELNAESGERLIFRELTKNNSLSAIGFRHDIPDSGGRLWRTETVLKRGKTDESDSFISFKTQCIAIGPMAKTDIPRKPYLIKSLISDSWPTVDGYLQISDSPIWLEENDKEINLARLIFESKASIYLPILYISACASNIWKLNRTSIEKIAYELGGVAHVVVEPSRSFSFNLREYTSGRNSYGGTIALVAPGYGIVQKFYKKDDTADEVTLAQNLRSMAVAVRSRMPVTGWDWLSLQEASLHDQRLRERNRLSSIEIERIYQEEITTKDERILELESQLASRPITAPLENTSNEELILDGTFSQNLGEELYQNEFSDRVRLAVMLCLKHAENDGLDKRSEEILKLLMERSSYSDDSQELRADLRKASRDAKRISGELTNILTRHGYIEKSDKKHVRLEPKFGMSGLESVTLSKTPGDHRSLENMRKQVEKALGITKF